MTASWLEDVDRRIADARAARYHRDEPDHDNLPPRRFVIADRALAQDEDRPGLCPRSFDQGGYRDEERQMAAALREATL